VDDERQLVADVLGRRPGAFERLVRDYQGLCWHVIQRMVRHPEDTRELCQEAFLRVHRNLHQYRFDAPLKAWIGQVAYSVALRHLERRRIPVDDAGDEALERIAGEDDVLAAVEGDDTLRALHAAIDALPPLQRTLLTLYHLDELPIGDIATITGLAENTIKSHLYRSRKRLRALLEPRIGVAA
jgi:RNA polymerase sigma-70 factor (ECF subfamily)